MNSKKSFDALKDFWYEQQTKLNIDGEPIYDLYENGQVKDEEGKEFSKSIKGIFQSTSAKSNAGIDALFENIGHRYFDPNFYTNEKDSKEKEEYEKKKNFKAQKKTQPQPQSRGIKIDDNKSSNKQQKKKFW